MSNKGWNNLIPAQHTLTVEEQSAGGRKSAEVRRKRRQAKDTLNILLGLPVKAGSVTDPDELNSIKDKSNTDCNTSILVNLVKQGLDGDINAMRLIYTLTGEYNTRMQIQQEITDESLRQYEEYISDFLRTTDEEESLEVDRSKLARMFEFYVYHDNLSEIAMRFNDRQLQEIHMWFNNADDAEKIDFTRKVLANYKIPPAESITLYEQKYLPEALKHFKEPEEPQSIEELLKTESSELDNDIGD